jgi:hypothetical protein
MVLQGQEHATEILLRDHDTRYTVQFDAILRTDGVEMEPVNPVPPT